MLSVAVINGLPGNGAMTGDDRTPGLFLRDGSRSKVWYYVKKNRGQVKKIRLGAWPEMGIAAARVAARMAGADLDKKVSKTQYAYTLQDVFERWAATREGEKRTLSEDRRKMGRELSFLAGHTITEISAAQIAELKKIMVKSPIAFNRSLALLKTIYNHAIKKMGIEVKNVAETVSKYPEVPRREKIPTAQAANFIRALSNPARNRDIIDIIAFLLFTGQRKGNVFAMEWAELDISAGVWIIPAAKAKNKHDMITPLSGELVEILRRRLAAQGETGGGRWVFPVLRQTHGVGPGHVRDIRWSYKKICADAGLVGLVIHDLRRTCGSWMLNAGASMEQVAKMLHHDDIRVTQKVYADLELQQVRAGVDLMRAAINKKMDEKS